MKEVRSPTTRAPIRRLAENSLYRDLYRVACYFHASSGISSSEDQTGMIPAMQLLAEEVQEPEIVRALLNVGLQMRLLDEQTWKLPQEKRKWFVYTAGLLWDPVDSNSPEPLSVREACNKIVHAEDIGFFVDDSAYKPDHFVVPRFLKPKISLYGSKANRDWRAEILIDDFVAAGFWLASSA